MVELEESGLGAPTVRADERALAGIGSQTRRRTFAGTRRELAMARTVDLGAPDFANRLRSS